MACILPRPSVEQDAALHPNEAWAVPFGVYAAAFTAPRGRPADARNAGLSRARVPKDGLTASGRVPAYMAVPHLCRRVCPVQPGECPREPLRTRSQRIGARRLREQVAATSCEGAAQIHANDRDISGLAALPVTSAG